MDVRHSRIKAELPAEILSDPRLEQLADWGRRLDALGVSPGTSGNLSCRHVTGFVISRTGAPLGELGGADWVLVTGITMSDDGALEVASQGPHEPSRDASVHAAMYDRLEAARAVFHLHPDHLDVLHERLGVPATARYFPAGTTESRDEIDAFLDRHPETRYFVLIDHGIVSWARTIDEAGTAVERFHRAVTQLLE